MLTPASRPRPADGILTQQAADQQILLKLDSGEYYALDDIGSRVWACCDGAHRIADIVTVICTEYEVPAATAEADVLDLLQELVDEQLLLEGH